MRHHESGQVQADAAEIYEELFVPAVFDEWARRSVAMAGVSVGDRCLDVATGTGVVARQLSRVCGPEGHVVGLDCNEGMLDVAQSVAPWVEWRHGTAEDLPFEEGFFDAVTCQFGLMFFTDPTRALREMARVLAPGGTAVVLVWGALELSPGYRALVEPVTEVLGATAAESIHAPFRLGSTARVGVLLRDAFAAEEASALESRIETMRGRVRFPSLHGWIETELRGWTLGAEIDDEQIRAVLEAGAVRLGEHVQADGSVEFPIVAHAATVRRVAVSGGLTSPACA